MLAETDLPKGAFSILPCHRDGADLFTTDDRLKLLSFTGSPAVGWDLKARAGKKKVVLELGGNAACIVDADADLQDATERLVFGAFYQSGQSCIGVQRILAHDNIYDELRDRLVESTKQFVAGDPKDEATFIGPMISEKEATRLESWITSAIEAGGQLLCGGKRNGAMLEATLLENVPKDQPVCMQEAFGPVAVLSRFSNFQDAIAEVNDSSFGLQAGQSPVQCCESFFIRSRRSPGGGVGRRHWLEPESGGPQAPCGHCREFVWWHRCGCEQCQSQSQREDPRNHQPESVRYSVCHGHLILKRRYLDMLMIGCHRR